MTTKVKIRVLVADDEAYICDLIAEELDKKRFQIKTAANGEQAWELLRQHQFDVAVLDLKMPRLSGMEVFQKLIRAEFPPETIMLTGHGDIQTAVEAMKLGAFDFMTKPVGIDKLELSIIRAFEKRLMRRENLSLRYALGVEAEPKQDIITEDEGMLAQLAFAEKIAAHDTTVLVEGESGTGKELVARRIHNRSPRVDNSFIAFNCAALPETLIESELFGYYKGAFTGAEKGKPGLFELADHGTLFFDEIGELALSAQSKLLRVLETSSFYRLGGTSEVTVDARIVAATNRNLNKMVEEGTFREDLFYRLNVMTVTLPPLRDRVSDIKALVEFFLNRGGFGAKKFSAKAFAALERHRWPGNVRELEHAVMHSAILTDGDLIDVTALPTAITGSGAPPPAASVEFRPLSLELMEKEHILKTLEYCDGKQNKASEVLGISPRTLYRKLREYGD